MERRKKNRNKKFMIDSKEINLKEEVSRLLNMKGKERGADYKYLVDYVVSKERESGFKKIKKELEKINYNLPDEKKIDNMDWLPISLTNIFLVATVKVFNWQEKDIINIGRGVVPSSPLVKFFIKHFLSPQKTIKKATENAWSKHYSKGKIEMKKFDKKKKEIILKISDMDWHPLTCIYHIGSLGGIVELIVGKKIKGEETKCIYKGNKYHEFKFNWE